MTRAKPEPLRQAPRRLPCRSSTPPGTLGEQSHAGHCQESIGQDGPEHAPCGSHFQAFGSDLGSEHTRPVEGCLFASNEQHTGDTCRTGSGGRGSPMRREQPTSSERSEPGSDLSRLAQAAGDYATSEQTEHVGIT